MAEDLDAKNPYRFSGKRVHGGTGTYDIGFRDYDPGINRFLTRDFYQGALKDLALGMDPWNTNRYAYAGGNPIGGVDLDGHAALAPNGDGSDSGSSLWDGVVDTLSGQGDAPQAWTSDGLKAPAPATTRNPSVPVSTGDGGDAGGGAVNAATETLEHANPALWAFSSLTGINPWEDASEGFNDKHGVDTTTNAYAAGGLALDVATIAAGGVAGKGIKLLSKAATRGGSAGHGYAKEVLPGGRADGQTVFAGHGGYRWGSGDAVVPEGTTLHLYSEFGKRISNALGRKIEVGGNVPPVGIFGPGSTVPNYTLRAPDNLVIHEGSVTVDGSTNLSDLLQRNMGVCH